MLTRAKTSSGPDDKEFMATLAKGLAVLGCFGRQRPTMTLSEAALAAGVSRATARRILRTLAELGYVDQHGRQFSLSPNILQLGFAYLATQSWIDRAVPLMKDLSERVGKSCSASILQGIEIVLWRACRPSASCRWRRRWGAACRPSIPPWAVFSSAFSTTPRFGAGSNRSASSRYPEHHHRPAGAVRAHPRRSRPGFSIVDEELERGLRAIAVPIVDRHNEVVAALNLSTHSTRTTRNEMRDRFLPELRAVAAQIALFVT